jgi:mono/diheme cytochrome c family protein
MEGNRMSRATAFFNPFVFLFAMLLTLVLCVSSAKAQDAAGLYKTKCAMCHGADGKGDTPAGKSTGVRSFSSPEVQKESDAELTQITNKGKGKMPAYEAKLTEPQIKDLVAYVRQLGKGK